MLYALLQAKFPGAPSGVLRSVADDLLVGAGWANPASFGDHLPLVDYKKNKVFLFGKPVCALGARAFVRYLSELEPPSKETGIGLAVLGYKLVGEDASVRGQLHHDLNYKVTTWAGKHNFVLPSEMPFSSWILADPATATPLFRVKTFKGTLGYSWGLRIQRPIGSEFPEETWDCGITAYPEENDYFVPMGSRTNGLHQWTVRGPWGISYQRSLTLTFVETGVGLDIPWEYPHQEPASEAPAPALVTPDPVEEDVPVVNMTVNEDYSLAFVAEAQASAWEKEPFGREYAVWQVVIPGGPEEVFLFVSRRRGTNGPYTAKIDGKSSRKGYKAKVSADPRGKGPGYVRISDATLQERMTQEQLQGEEKTRKRTRIEEAGGAALMNYLNVKTFPIRVEWYRAVYTGEVPPEFWLPEQGLNDYWLAIWADFTLAAQKANDQDVDATTGPLADAAYPIFGDAWKKVKWFTFRRRIVNAVRET